MVSTEVAAEGWTRAAGLAQLRAQGRQVFTGADRPVVLFYEDGQVCALDNRCPHLGFPLSRGTVADGMLTCHWHHAQFDLRSGCTFSLWAGDVPAYETRVEADDVFIRPRTGRDPLAYWRRRLREGMSQNVDLVMVKAVAALLDLGMAPRQLASEAGLWCAQNTPAFSSGLVILTAMAHVAELVPARLRALALSHGVTAAAGAAAGQAPFRERTALERDDLDPASGRRWLRQWAGARERDGAERTLRTMLRCGHDPATIVDALFSALTDRVYADGGHSVDFTLKAVELAELVGWAGGAEAVLPCAIPGALVGARGAEESDAWRRPVDLLALLASAEQELPAALREGRGARRPGHPAALAAIVLGDDPAATVTALLEALRAGMTAVDLAQAVAHAAALRIAHFGSSNEFSDWDTALHSFTYCQAMHHVLARAESPELLRGVFHGALAVYQDRFLNVPPARLPRAQDVAQLPADGSELCALLLRLTDAQGGLDDAARVVARYLDGERPVEPLLAALAEGVLREDAAFHTFQMLEAGIRLWQQWDGAPEGRLGLLAVARYAAAHAPTQRAFGQTVSIAERLQRGEALQAGVPQQA